MHGRTLTAEGTALAPGGPVRYVSEGVTTTPPAPPTASGHLSDLPWIRAVNGWGPVERDSSNGKSAAGDGTPISFGGTTYAKGLGVHAYSDIAFHLGGAATRAVVYGDDRVLAATGTLKAATGPVALDVDVRGVRVLRLEVADADHRTSFDHTSWAGAHVTVG